MLRRSFLRGLLFAPVAAPFVAAAAAAKEEAAPSTAFTLKADKFVIGSRDIVAKYTVVVDEKNGGHCIGLRFPEGEFERRVAIATRYNTARRL